MQHLYAITNISELQKLNPRDAEHVRVAGYRNPADGGGGEFYWDVNSKLDVDQGMFFKARMRYQDAGVDCHPLILTYVTLERCPLPGM